MVKTKEPKTISVINAKGGVGKTTFVDQLAFNLTSRGFKVEVADLDEQQGSQFHQAVDVPENPDIVVIDTRGSKNSGIDNGGEEISITEIMKGSDLVVIPVTLDQDSIDPLAKTVAKCEKVGVPYRIFENRTEMHTSLHQDIDAEIRDAHPKKVSTVRIPKGTVVGSARRFNISWEEADKRAKPVIAFNKAVEEILEMVGL